MAIFVDIDDNLLGNIALIEHENSVFVDIDDHLLGQRSSCPIDGITTNFPPWDPKQMLQKYQKSIKQVKVYLSSQMADMVNVNLSKDICQVFGLTNMLGGEMSSEYICLLRSHGW